MTSDNERKKKSEVIIRQMEIDDLSAVYHLGEKLFTSEELPILYRTWDAHEVTEYFTSDSEYCLVAEVDGRIGGFIIANTIIKEGTAWKRYGYLAWIGVDEQYQRTGLGERLYRRLEEMMTGAPKARARRSVSVSSMLARTWGRLLRWMAPVCRSMPWVHLLTISVRNRWAVRAAMDPCWDPGKERFRSRRSGR